MEWRRKKDGGRERERHTEREADRPKHIGNRQTKG